MREWDFDSERVPKSEPVDRAVATFLECRSALRKRKGGVTAGDVAEAGAACMNAVRKVYGITPDGFREDFMLSALTRHSGIGWEVGETRKGIYLFVF